MPFAMSDSGIAFGGAEPSTSVLPISAVGFSVLSGWLIAGFLECLPGGANEGGWLSAKSVAVGLSDIFGAASYVLPGSSTPQTDDSSLAESLAML